MGVFHTIYESKYHSIYKNENFETRFIREKHPLHVFLVLNPLKLIFVNYFLRFPIFGVLREPPPKENRVLDENLQRNQFSKLNFS